MKEADTYYSSVISSKKIPKPTISDGGKVLSYNATSGKYFSNKITIDNLKTTYGGSNDTVTYTLSAKVGNNSVSICSNSKGTKCETGEITITDVTSYSFYVYVDKDKVKAGDTVNINIKGSNKSTYYSSVLYEDTTHNDAQKLIVIDKYEVSRSRSNSSTQN